MTGKPYLVVSGDSHAGPTMDDLRPYCPATHRDEFEAFASAHEATLASGRRVWSNGAYAGKAADRDQFQLMSDEARADGLARLERVLNNPGSRDATARLSDMDEQGVAAEVIFAGAQNRQVLPWAGGTGAGSADTEPELRKVGVHIWNEWLAAFCSVAPERLLGVAQIPIWDIDAAVQEVWWAKELGLRAVNFPAPRFDYPSYNETEVYEPLWTAVEAAGLPLVTHSASGEAPSGSKGEGASSVFRAENLWLSRRALSQLIFGKVFDRHPSLVVAFVEQRGYWVPEQLRELDSQVIGIADSAPAVLLGSPIDLPERLPSDYWRSNLIVADSFMAPFEAQMRDEIGLETLMWGSDYPHLEGTWPNTRVALRNTFAGIPEADVRAILGDNAVRAFNLDCTVLEPVADRIGPTPDELSQPVRDDELPAYKGLAFRVDASYH